MPKLNPKDARLELRLPSEMKAEIEADASERDMNPSQLVRWLYREWKEAGKPKTIRPAKK